MITLIDCIVFLSSLDPDRWGLERGDVWRHRVPGRSQRQGHGLLHLLHRPDAVWQLYPPHKHWCPHKRLKLIIAQYVKCWMAVLFIVMWLLCWVYGVCLCINICLWRCAPQTRCWMSSWPSLSTIWPTLRSSQRYRLLAPILLKIKI